MRTGTQLAILVAGTLLASCGRDAGDEQPDIAERSASGEVNRSGGEHRAAPSNEAGGGLAAGSSICARVEAAEARRFVGLELAGTSGGYRFYGRGRELLCSEPGAGGRGECEIPGAAEIRVEGPDATYGFRTSGGVPAILTYSPEGVSCRDR